MQQAADRKRDAGDAKEAGHQRNEQHERDHREKQQSETQQRDGRKGQQDHDDSCAKRYLGPAPCLEALYGVASPRRKYDQGGQCEQDQAGAVAEKGAQRLVGADRAQAPNGEVEDEAVADAAAVEAECLRLVGRRPGPGVGPTMAWASGFGQRLPAEMSATASRMPATARTPIRM